MTVIPACRMRRLVRERARQQREWSKEAEKKREETTNGNVHNEESNGDAGTKPREGEQQERYEEEKREHGGCVRPDMRWRALRPYLR